MNFSWPEEYLTFKDAIIQFAKTELNGEVQERDEQQIFPRALWKKCADFGIHGLSLPKAYGGSLKEDNFLRSMLAMEGFGYACQDNGLAFRTQCSNVDSANSDSAFWK